MVHPPEREGTPRSPASLRRGRMLKSSMAMSEHCCGSCCWMACLLSKKNVFVLFYDHVGLFALKKWGGKGLMQRECGGLIGQGECAGLCFFEKLGGKGQGR